MIDFKIDIVVDEVFLVVFGVLVRAEVGGRVCEVVSLPLLSNRPLFVLETVFFFGC